MAGLSVLVAFQGELGAYSEEAVRRYWPGDSTEPVPKRSCAEVVRALEDGAVDFGMLPIENSLAGNVVATYDALSSAHVCWVVGETILPIHHSLLALPGAHIDSIERVASHPVALAQCGRFLERHPRMEAEAAYDTAGAASDVAASGDPARAAIAGRGAAERFGLEILASDIEDRSDNQTRFFALSREQAVLRPGTEARTAIIASTLNVPAALYRLLDPVAEAGLNLSKLDSRPTGEPWSYSFYLEIEHLSNDPKLAGVLSEMQRRSENLRILGQFQRAPTSGGSHAEGRAEIRNTRGFVDGLQLAEGS
ncbi:MAG TPA: prephenate dehydratase domain-containing protein [Gemmatimonadaceae bacterium]|nr:prephenate dehydratase domain-containing protein [Gemmatimonadaceae bacterium]